MTVILPGNGTPLDYFLHRAARAHSLDKLPMRAVMLLDARFSERYAEPITVRASDSPSVTARKRKPNG